MTRKNIKVIIDTNVQISFLIGKKLHSIIDYISNGEITIIICSELLQEILEVTSRPKLKKYFPENKVFELINLLETIGELVKIIPLHQECNDPKDNFLLDMIEYSGADFLITGDKELLILNPFLTAIILSPQQFETTISKILQQANFKSCPLKYY